MEYHIPAGNTPDNYAMRVLANVLATGESSRLYQLLVKEKQLATDVEAQAESRRGRSMFCILVHLRPGVKTEDVERAIYEEIEHVQKNGITERELEKARTQFRRSEIQSGQSDLNLAVTIGQYAVYFNDPDLINTIFEKYNAVTVGQVKQAAVKYLVPTERTVVIDLPAAKTAPAAAGK